MYQEMRALPYHDVALVERNAPVDSLVHECAQREKMRRDEILEEEKRRAQDAALEEEMMLESNSLLNRDHDEDDQNDSDFDEDEFKLAAAKILADELSENYPLGMDDHHSAEECPECGNTNTDVIAPSNDSNISKIISIFNALDYLDGNILLPGKLIAACPECDNIYIGNDTESPYFKHPEEFE